MKRNQFYKTLPLLLMLIITSPSYGQSARYISDELIVNFRTGPGNEFRIERRLKSGTKVIFIEEIEDSDWSKVALENGTEGYMLNQYLRKTPTASVELASFKEELTKTQSLNKTLTEENTALTQQLDSTEKENLAYQKNTKKINDELTKIKSISAGAVELDKHHKELLKKYQLLLTERESLAAENLSLLRNQRISEWMYGAGIFIAGIITTILLPLFRRKKAYSEWSS